MIDINMGNSVYLKSTDGSGIPSGGLSSRATSARGVIFTLRDSKHTHSLFMCLLCWAHNYFSWLPEILLIVHIVSLNLI